MKNFQAGVVLAFPVDSCKLSFHSSFMPMETKTTMPYLGKTMLMDMFYSATEEIVRHRRRLHFHEASARFHFS